MNTFKEPLSDRPGYSLLELALVIAVLGIISVMAIALSTASIERNRLRSMETLAVQGIRRAHKKSLHNVEETMWGVYFCMPATDTGCCDQPDCKDDVPTIEIFKGSTYDHASAEVTNEIVTSPDTVFSGDLYDASIATSDGLIFEQLSGETFINGTAVSGSITIANDNFSSTITINKKGVVQHE